MISGNERELIEIKDERGEVTEAFVMRGSLWLRYRDIGSIVLDQVADEMDLDSMTANIRANAARIAAAATRRI